MSKQKPWRYWNRETIKTEYYKLKERLGQVPKAKENGGMSFAISQGKYDPNITTWNGFLKDIGEELNREGDIWNRETILGAFYGYKEELGRTPKAREFAEKTGGALAAIYDGKYDPNIRRWNGFLRDVKEKIRMERDKWDQLTIMDAFYTLKKKLKRTPTSGEMPSGAIGALEDGKYDPKIKTWNKFLKDLKEDVVHDVNKWNRKTIKKAFYGLKKELGRRPTREEFTKRYGGPRLAIQAGKYDPNITTWTAFLDDIGEDNHRIIWDREIIKKTFYGLKKKLRRVPSLNEMPGGLNGAIRGGKYDPNITTWNKFLEDLGEKIRKKTKMDKTSLLEDIAGADST